MAVHEQTLQVGSVAALRHPGKQRRPGLSYISYTLYIFLCLFPTALTSGPFFWGALRGLGQNECGEPLHA